MSWPSWQGSPTSRECSRARIILTDFPVVDVTWTSLRLLQISGRSETRLFGVYIGIPAPSHAPMYLQEIFIWDLVGIVAAASARKVPWPWPL